MRINRKTVITALVIVLAVQFIFTGCGKKTVDYNVNDSSDKTNVSDNGNTSGGGNIRNRLSVPASINKDLDTGNSGLDSIAINCEEVLVPETDNMVICYMKAENGTNEDKKRIAEAVFEKDKGIYLYDYETKTKEDIQKEIDNYNSILNDSNTAGDDEYIANIKINILELEKMLITAPDSYEAAGNYSTNAFRGTVNDIPYVLNVEWNEEEAPSAKGYRVYYSAFSTLDVRPCEGAVEGYIGAISTDYETEENVNKGTMTEEEAGEIAIQFLNKVGISDVELTQSDDLLWWYYNSSYEEIASEYDGYYLQLTKTINGVPVYSEEMLEDNYLKTNDIWLKFPKEKYVVIVYDGRIIEADWEQVFGTEEKKEPAELLSFDKIIESANKEIAKYFEKYPTQYSNVKFNEVKLTYQIVSDGNNGYKYIPVWAFSQKEENAYSDNPNATKHLVMINAIDGTAIDLIEEAKKLGCYFEGQPVG